MRPFESLRVLITGASRGIGRAVALGLAARGAKVALLARSASDLEALAREIAAAGGLALPVPADVASPREVEAALDTAEGWLGGLDAVVHGAASLGPVGPLTTLDPAEWESALAVNLTGTFLVARGAARRMEASGGGVVVLLTSGLAVEPQPRLGAYASAKAGIAHLARVLAAEVAPAGVRVELFDPGMADTDMHATLRALGPGVVGADLHRALLAAHEAGDLRTPGAVADELLEVLAAPLQGAPAPHHAPARQARRGRALRVALLSVVDDRTPAMRITQQMSPPLGLLSMGAVLQHRFDDVEVRVTTELEEVIAFAPNLCGVSAVTQCFGLAEKAAGTLADTLGVPVLVGGVHFSALPGRLPEACAAGVVGEGEETLAELVALLRRRGGLHPDDLAQVRGIVFRGSDGRTHATPPRAPIEDLDSLPLPARTSLDRSGAIHLVTSRGCPYGCSFCSTGAFWGTRFRAMSAPRVAEAVRAVLPLGPPVIKFFDDLFVTSRRRVRELADLFVAEGLRPEHGYWCFAAAGLLGEDTVRDLARMGFLGVGVGVETGSDEVLPRLKPRTTTRVTEDALALLADHGIAACCSFVLGTPGETMADLSRTIEFIDRNEHRIHQIELCPLVPLPGTPFWPAAVRTGKVHEAMDWSRLRDVSVLDDFDPDRHVYLNDAMPYADFLAAMEAFRELYAHFEEKRERVDATLNARLKSLESYR